MNTAPYAAIVGGMSMDIFAFPSVKLVRGDSTPGRAVFSPGGVGRNIAENLARIGVRTELFSVVGDDELGRGLVETCARTGIGTASVRRLKGETTSTYLSIQDETGETVAGIAAMDICERITPELAGDWADGLAGAAVIVIDGNLPAPTITALAGRFRDIPIVLDPVSRTKAPRSAAALPFARAIKPSREEAEALCGFPVSGLPELRAAAAFFHGKGIARVFISLGSGGVFASEAGRANQALVLPAPEVPVVNTTGAGDAFTAGIVAGFLAGLDLDATARYARAMSGLALASDSAVNPGLTREAVNRFLNERRD